MGYRLDIQLLRAFAVIVVVLYHLQVPFFSKGFLGVDVFFVISGFLMAILYKQGQPIEFFKRRVRRLLPPYFAVLLATMIYGALTILPNESSQLIEQSVYSLLFAANIGFWNEASYFSSSAFKPLLHLWSLGVEVQYYLFVPLIMLAFRKFKLSIVLMAAGSFVLCALMLYISPKTSFFMMPLRAWEFLIGAIAGLYFTDRGSVRNASMAWLGSAGAVGLLVIQVLPVEGEALGFMYGHPGLAALSTCFATMLIMVFGLPVRILESAAVKPLAYIGKLSYSIYLIHFPVIVFYFYQPFHGTVLSNGKATDALTLVAVITVLSLLCYHLVEKPGPRLNQVIIAGVTSAAVAILGMTSHAIINKRFNEAELGILMANQDRAVYRCGKVARLADPSSKVCLLDSSKRHLESVLLVGNSHADSIKMAFNEVAGSFGYNTYFLVPNSPLMARGMGVDQVINEAASKNIGVIVTHHSPSAVQPETYLRLHDAAAKRGMRVVVIAPVPVYEEHIPEALYGAYQNSEQGLALQTRSSHLTSIDSTLHSLRDISSAHPDGFLYYDPSSYLCDEDCNLKGADGRAWYFDSDHLTLTGARQLNPLFEDMFSRLVSFRRDEIRRHE